jgi:hypothetical protein
MAVLKPTHNGLRLDVRNFPATLTSNFHPRAAI